MWGIIYGWVSSTIPIQPRAGDRLQLPDEVNLKQKLVKCEKEKIYIVKYIVKG